MSVDPSFGFGGKSGSGSGVPDSNLAFFDGSADILRNNDVSVAASTCAAQKKKGGAGVGSGVFNFDNVQHPTMKVKQTAATAHTRCNWTTYIGGSAPTVVHIDKILSAAVKFACPTLSNC